MAYIFSDFVRIWYYVLALAIDGLFIPLIFQYRPARLFHIASMTWAGGTMELYFAYMISVVCILEAGAVWLEAVQYRKRWPRDRSTPGDN